jgi:hypothetical protein
LASHAYPCRSSPLQLLNDGAETRAANYYVQIQLSLIIDNPE